MSSSDDREKEQQPTVAWDPEDIPGVGEGEEPGDAAPSDDDPLVGELIRDKWRVLARLGAGSYGTVYKVEDVTGGWIEALKILGVDRITGSEAETVRKRFLREAQIMKRLGAESQHIVGLSTYEEDLDDGLIYFLMEFVEGRSLGAVLEEEGPLSVERTIELALQVCDALIVAHEGPDGVVHRDLKLENLMLTEDRAGQEIVKVLDFGIAKIAESDPDSRLTTAGTLGTPGYAAPEQIRAEDVDARTDLFAFGVILYALLTGRDPWLGKPANEPTHQIYDLMAASERGAVRPMSETGVEVPPAVQNVVMRLLRRDPDDRFQSARALKEVLEKLAAGGDIGDAGLLRVLTDEAGVEVEVRSGRRTVARGPTPCVATDLAPGSYKVVVQDPRFEPLETTVELDPGGLEDVTVVTRAREEGVGAAVRRRSGLIAAGLVLLLLGAGAAVLRPWGRTVDLAELRTRAAAGEITDVRTASAGLEGRLDVAFLPIPVRVPLGADQVPGAVSELREAGVEVDASWQVDRLAQRAAEAQAELRYYGAGDATVRSYAERIRALAPGSELGRSLLLKVGERMAWDADAALDGGRLDDARALVGECLELVPDHPRCEAVSAKL